MAKKAESFRVIDRVDKKTNKRIKELVLYSNVIPTEAEKIAKERLNTLYTYEADKAVKVYRECRRTFLWQG